MKPLAPGLCLLLWASHLPAQGNPTEYVYHVYVDPIYGDNYLAWRLNPVKPQTTEGNPEWVGTSGAPGPMTFQTNLVQEDRPLQLSYEYIPPPPPILLPNLKGRHYHAPYPFKTITTSQAQELETGPSPGALKWITNIIGPLPATIQTEPALTITHVIIHLLPGLYGPIDRDAVNPPSQPKDVNPANGLPWNGEVFPIVLPDRVSLQGTSALDTILDARGSQTETLESGVVPLTNAAIITVSSPTPEVGTHAESFIDGLTIRNAKVIDPLGSPGTQGAGIYIGGEGRVLIKIGNCFFFNNDVGIAIETDTTVSPHVPTILNNTFTQNLIGIWNGNRGTPSPPQFNIGKGEPMICNNVIDARPPVGTTIVSAAFQGVHPDDLRTKTVTYIPSGSSLVVQVSHVVDYNAYQPAAANPLVTLSTYWPMPTLRTTLPPSPYVPRKDITPWTWGSTRGALFIADTFRLSVGSVSTHDFRLTPRATQGTSPPPTGTAGLNPLINQGINLGLNGSGNTVTLITYTPIFGTASPDRILSPVGIPKPGSHVDTAQMQLWDHDCDGFGNARITRKNISGGGFQHPFGDIDLGADETDELTISGYLDGTRIFSRPHSVSGQSFVDNITAGIPTRVAAYLFNTNVGVNIDRPRFNFFEDVTGSPYYNHILWDPDATYQTGSPNPLTGKSNFTYGRPGTLRYSLTYPSPQPPYVYIQPGFSRNLICDFAPVLLPSLNCWWPWDFDTAQVTGTPHRYGNNPWWGHWNRAFATFCNPSVFWNVPGSTPHNTIAVQGPPGIPYTVPLAIINAPPGSMEWDVNMSNVPNSPPTSTSHLILPLPAPYTLVWGPWTPCAGTSSTQYQVGIWGWGDTAANCPDIVPLGPNGQWDGLRVNCERFPNATFPNNHSNLQTFLIIQGLQGAEAARQSSSPCYPSGKPGTTRLSSPAYIGPVRKLVCKAMRDGIRTVEWSK